jgi:hypothetical protein
VYLSLARAWIPVGENPDKANRVELFLTSKHAQENWIAGKRDGGNGALTQENNKTSY